MVVGLGASARLADAQRSISFIRDTEIEAVLRAYATPLFRAANLDPEAVRIYLVNDRQINAFVAGGQNLFFNTGLLIETEDASEVIGVIAHEIGHIEGGHLARMHDALKRGTAESIVAIVLGAAAAAAGRPDVGTAVIAGGQNVALRNFLQYTRTQEGAADAAAMRYLDETKQSARGLLRFFEELSSQELVAPSHQDPYLRTHPLTRDRINALAYFVASSPHSDAPPRADFQVMHERMRAKLRAFLDDPALTLRQYPPTDQTLVGRYARAIAYHKLHKATDALAEIDGLIRESPGDPYFHELKGQILLETGRAAEAREPYQKAVSLAPRAPLLRVDLARVQLALGDEYLAEAESHLRAALTAEPNRPFTWRQLAIALGRQGQLGESSLALAEEAFLLGNLKDARFHAAKADRLLPPGSPGRLRAEDIRQTAEREEAKRRD